MKIGIISDIHSNIYAFKACTEYLEKQCCNEYIFLGDYISDTPYARETLRICKNAYLSSAKRQP